MTTLLTDPFTNQIGNITTYAYDAMGRKTNEVNPGVTTNQFTFSGAGDLLKLTDGKNQTTTWNYDTYGRVTNKLDAANNVLFLYTYDADGRLQTRWTPAKGTTSYGYDNVGNLLTINYPQSTINLAYDLLNRLTNMVDAAGTTSYSYDAASQLLSEDGPWSSDTVSYTYVNRLRKSLSVQAPNGSSWSQTYGYDPVKRLTNITSVAGSFGYAYDALRSTLPALVALPNGSVITNTYDGSARLLSTRIVNSVGSLLNSHAYTYNQANQRTQQVFTAGNYVNYGYDPIGELTSAKGKEASAADRLNEQLGYAYDAAGNLNFRTNNALLQAFSVNNLNELTTETNSGSITVAGTTTSAATDVTVYDQGQPPTQSAAALYADSTFASLSGFPLNNGNNVFTAVAHDSLGRADTATVTTYLPATNSFTYDLNGNLLSDGLRSFEYDAENQLTNVMVTNAWKSEFVYDGKMRRRIRREYTWQSSIGDWQLSSETRYIYDGNVAIQERDVNNLPQVTYTRGRDLSGSLQGAGGIGGLLARTDHHLSTINSPQSTSYYHADGNGNITCLVNTKQVLVAKYIYDPFGNILSQSGSLADANLYRFSSKEFHALSGLVYYLYRFYDPTMQRWLNRDPLANGRLSADSTELMDNVVGPFELSNGGNLYHYVYNNPVNRFDPFGLDVWIIRSCSWPG
jgi:RHS repeat-associated protein